MERRLPILMAFLFVLPNFFYAQFSNWQWAKAAASPNNEKGWDVAYDKTSGCAYVAGLTEGGLGNVYGTLFSSMLGSKDGFVAKYSSTGNVIWAFHIGSSSTDEIKSIAVDPFGNIYVIGTFQALMDFDPGVGVTSLLPNTASQDGFLAKYNSSGNLIWATKFGGTSTDDVWKVYADSNGVYVCGSYIGSSTFYSTNSTIKSTAAIQSQTNFFGAKYNSSGVVQWVVSGGSAKNDVALDVVADKNKVYFTGSYERDFTIYNAAGLASGTLQILSSDKGDVFVLSYNQDGSFAWGTNACSQDVDEGHAITQDNDNVYIAGSFRSSSLNFPFPTPIISRTNKGGDDIFIACLSKATGTWQWVSSQTGSGNDDEEAYEMETDNNGNLVVTGYFKDQLDYSLLGGSLLSSAGNEDIFLAGFSKSNGNYLWGQRSGSSGSDIPHGISVNDIGETYMAGDYSGAADFGQSIINGDNGDNIFVAKTGCAYLANNSIPASMSVCATAPPQINGSSPSGGTPGSYSFLWQESTDGNTWQAAAGTNTMQNYTPPVLNSSLYYQRIVTAPNVCNNTLASNVMYLKADQASPISSAGSDQFLCGTTSATLNGNTPAVGTGSWTIINGIATLNSPFNPASIVTNVGTNSVTLRWTIQNGLCPANFDDVVLTKEVMPSPALACADMEVQVPEATLTAVAPSSGVGYWSVIQGSGSFSDANNPVTTITSLDDGKTIVRWTIASRGCGENSDDVVITLKGVDIPNAFTPNGDNMNDAFVIGGIERYSGVKLSVYNRWGNLVYFSPEYKNTWKGTNLNNERLCDDTYYYTLEIQGKKNYNGFLVLKQK